MNGVINLIKQKNISLKKRFGQNFITDANLLNAIVDDAEISDNDIVVEIGAGAGTLTSSICRRANTVYAFEIDADLKPILDITLKDFDNVRLIFKDILKLDPKELKGLLENRKFKVVANLPYYITSPVLFYFLENDFYLDSITVMVQKEVAMRMVAKHNTIDYGTLSLAVQSRAEAIITRIVDRKMFFPEPNVDSAVVRLTMTGDIGCRKTFDKLVKAAFSCRRKTLLNNLTISLGFSRVKAEQLLIKAGLDPKIRGEALNKEKFMQLAQIIDQDDDQSIAF